MTESLRAYPGLYLGTYSDVYLGVYSQGRKLGVCNGVKSGVYFRVFLRECNEVYLAVSLQVLVYSMMFSIQRTQSHSYHSNPVNA